MKKYIILAISLILFAGCGVGSHSVQSGRADAASISFVSIREMPVQVSIDGTVTEAKTVKASLYKKKKDFKATTANTISIAPGTHEVKVTDNAGNEIFSKKLFISNQEHRVVEL